MLCLPLVASCINDKLEPCQPEISDIAGYLQLTVTTAGDRGTRANPTGGELGDGYEHGLENENTIHNLTIFLYRDGNIGLDGNYKIEWYKYVDAVTVNSNEPEYPYDRIYNVRIPLTQDDFTVLKTTSGEVPRVAVVANAGDLTERVELYNYNINNICRYRGYGNAWKEGETAGTSDYFVMSSAFNGSRRNDSHMKDGRIYELSNSTEGKVFTCEVTLERVAARIDLQYSGDEEYNEENGQLTYKVKDVNHTVTLTNTIPVNLMQNNSYLVKRLSDGKDVTASSNLFCAADESVIGNIPNNYVISPNFFDKPNEAKLDEWYGDSRASRLRNLGEEDIVNECSMDSYGPSITVMSDWNQPTNDKAIIITYANENTHPEELQVTKYEDDGTTVATRPSDYLTGLLFRAQYHPEKVYTSGAIGNEAPSEKYTDGDDFWLFRTVGANNTNVVEEKYNIYFASENALNEYVATLPAGGRYETVHYPGGICYYNVWIKHANIDDSDENFPMKYGIVRNNIYRISLNFNGIGQPTPEITEPRNVTSRIYVIKWNFRPQDPIIM